LCKETENSAIKRNKKRKIFGALTVNEGGENETKIIHSS